MLPWTRPSCEGKMWRVHQSTSNQPTMWAKLLISRLLIVNCLANGTYSFPIPRTIQMHWLLPCSVSKGNWAVWEVCQGQGSRHNSPSWEAPVLPETCSYDQTTFGQKCAREWFHVRVCLWSLWLVTYVSLVSTRRSPRNVLNWSGPSRHMDWPHHRTSHCLRTTLCGLKRCSQLSKQAVKQMEPLTRQRYVVWRVCGLFVLSVLSWSQAYSVPPYNSRQLHMKK